MTRPKVLIIGGYGVFGGKLARRLAKTSRLDVIVAGRSLEKAQAFVTDMSACAAAIDIASQNLSDDIRALAPDIIVDASGPYQLHHGYRTAKAALDAGAHYIDLSDDAAFSSGIAGLNDSAIRKGLTLLSGASSVPAISSTVCDHLRSDFTQIDLIESAILPGNRAPRGKSVMRSILLQAGRPLNVWRSGRWTKSKGWSERAQLTLTIPGLKPLNRPANLIGAPDLVLFPERYQAKTVLFRAGLDLPIMHHGLSILGRLASLPLRFQPERLTAPLKWIADRLEPLGGDRGGMIVRMVGHDPSGNYRETRWTLIVEDGDGPDIPATPAFILINKLLDRGIKAGARPCLGEFSLSELDTGLRPLRLKTHIETRPSKRLFETILGASFNQLPTQLQALHTVSDQRIWGGEARITRGKSLRSKVAGWLAGFPEESETAPVQVTMYEGPRGEIWQRKFGVSGFRSNLSHITRNGGTVLIERFGLMRFEIGLNLKDGCLHYPVLRGTVFRLPLPKWLLPVSNTFEHVDHQGRACFNVNISLPLAGPVVHYKGWLEPL